MFLGDSVQLNLTTRNLMASIAFYKKLSWQVLDEGENEATLTDGNLNIHLVTDEDAPSPMLSYHGSDIDAVRDLFNPDKLKRKGPATGRASFKSPNGLPLALNERKAKFPMPDGTPSTRQPLSILGHLGEFSLPVSRIAPAVNFWSKLGYEPLNSAQIPHPYAVVSDGLFVIGLHESSTMLMALAYFAPDMASRILLVESAGVEIRPLMQTDAVRIENAAFISPEGLTFLLFTGEPFLKS
jgi:predicted lactoylglutathione lyase